MYSSILKCCRSAKYVVMHYIPGTDKSSEILTTNMGKKRRGKITSQKKKYGPKSQKMERAKDLRGKY